MTRPACITHYDALYASGYFAHQDGVTSFNVQGLPPIAAEMARSSGNKLVDIGGGNGAFVKAIADYGVKGLTVDAADREAEDFIRHDIASYAPESASALRRRIVARLGENYLVTCFDVAEHIDVEHLPDFILNLATLVTRRSLISISTRPSSAGNRYHASILPIETWKALFVSASFSVSVNESAQMLRSPHRFEGSDANLVAVSHWQRINPFREGHDSHQHYLVLERPIGAPIQAGHLREIIKDAVDIAYRTLKRRFLAGLEFPFLTYHVNFIQDWSFARSLMDVWPEGRFRATVRKDIVATPYCHLIEGALCRNDVKHAMIDTVAEGIAALDKWGDLENTLVMTATEGLRSITHLMGSLMLFSARIRGARTLSMQHGMTISRGFSPAAAVVGAWDAGSGQELAKLAGDESSFAVELTGSPKFLDALLPPSSSALLHRFGTFVADYARSILIGLNLHWGVHSHSPEATYQWIARLCARNPDTLFILRPHPDDATIYEQPALLQVSNLMLIDELTLLSMDWPVSRLVSAVDGVLTTYSTLVIDAVAARKPVALLPYSDSARNPSQYLRPSQPRVVHGGIVPTLNSAEWTSGTLPTCLANARGTTMVRDDTWFGPSWTCLSKIVQIASRSSPSGKAKTASEIGLQLLDATYNLNLDRNPHPDRTRIIAALDRFLKS